MNEKHNTTVLKKKAGMEIAANVVLRYSVGTNEKAILKGPVMNRVQDTVPYVEFPQTVHIDFYDVHDSLEDKLDARYAKYKESEGKLLLRDSVKVINIKGDTLYCQELYWDKNRVGTELYTEKPVRIRTRTQIIDGIGMEARQDFKEWHILKPVGIVSVQSADAP